MPDVQDLRNRLEIVAKGAPEPRFLDLRDRLSALDAGVGWEDKPVPIMKQDLLAILRGILGAKSREELDRFLSRAKEILESANLLTNLEIPRVDLVQNPANMRPFLVTKANGSTGEVDLWLEELDGEVPTWALSG